MQKQISGHNVPVTTALREFTEKKLEKLDSYKDLITHLHITFNVDKLIQIAEAQVSVPGHPIHVKAEAQDMYQAVDELLDKILRQLKKT